MVRFFHVEVCWNKTGILFVGRETDVAIAGYVFAFLRRAGRSALREYEAAEKRQRRKCTALKRGNFLAGFCYGLHSQLDPRRASLHLSDQQNALVFSESKAREAKMAELVREVRIVKEKPMRKVWSAAHLGFVTGRDTQIRRPLAQPEILQIA